VGTIDEIKASYGEDFFERKAPLPHQNWCQLCICGHLDRYHSPSVGGAYQLTEHRTQTIRGQEVAITVAFFGCVGALKARNFEELTYSEIDREHNTMVERINVTCPCEEFRPVVTVDRPNRYFNQRMPNDRVDPARHPFMVGIRAFMTHLSKRKQAVANPDWYAEEFDRRFVWIEGKRVCGMSRCTETDDVFPIFVTDTGDGRSELRCAKHR
jgi:hypothetical protein